MQVQICGKLCFLQVLEEISQTQVSLGEAPRHACSRPPSLCRHDPLRAHGQKKGPNLCPPEWSLLSNDGVQTGD